MFKLFQVTARRFAAGIVNHPKSVWLCSLIFAGSLTAAQAAPTMPTGTSPGLTASPGSLQSSSTVTLSWNAVSGATYYDLGVRDMVSGNLVVDTTTTAASYSVTLTAGRTYRWNVAAGNSTGESSFTTALYFQTPMPVIIPAIPTGTSPGSTSSPGTSQSSTTVTLSWNASSGATYYDLGVRDMSTGNLVVDTTTSATSYTVTLTAGKTYRWNVAAGNSAGESPFTTALYFQILTGPPQPPMGASPGSTSSPGPQESSTTVTLSWNPSSGATYYDLGVRDMSTGNLVVDTTTTGTSYTVTLTAGRTYRWNVAAGNSTGESSFTTALYFQMPPITPPPPTGTNPGSTSSPGPPLSSPTVTLSWNSSSGATYYDLGIRDMATGNLVVNTTTTATNYTTTLPTGSYRWNVAAGNSAGESTFTTPLYFQIGNPVPATPTNTSPGLTSSPGVSESDTTVTLSWNASGGATYYDLGVRDMGTGDLVVDTTTTATNYTVTLTAGKTYRWNVAAGNSVGESSFTAPLYLQTSDTNPPDYPGATWVSIAQANQQSANRSSSDVRWIVIHTTEGTKDSAIQRFQNPDEQASAHYLITQDGSVIQMVHDKDISFGAGNFPYNTACINIEHERYDANDVTDAQYKASAALVKWLAARYNVQILFPGAPDGIAPADPASGTGIIGHHQVPDPTNPALGGGLNHHTDPVNWNWSYYESLFVTTPQPVLTGIGGGPLLPPVNGQFNIEVHGNQSPMTIQASDDLIHWTNVGTVPLVNGTGVFTDSNAGAHPQRYYRPKP